MSDCTGKYRIVQDGFGNYMAQRWTFAGETANDYYWVDLSLYSHREIKNAEGDIEYDRKRYAPKKVIKTYDY